MLVAVFVILTSFLRHTGILEYGPLNFLSSVSTFESSQPPAPATTVHLGSKPMPRWAIRAGFLLLLHSAPGSDVYEPGLGLLCPAL